MFKNPALKCFVVLALSLPAGFLRAQTTTPPSTPPVLPKHKRSVPVMDHAAFAKAAHDLQSPNINSITGTITADSYDSDIVLPPMGIKALQLSNKFVYDDRPLKINDDGWVTYEYGHVLPLIILEPKHLSAILLEKGEVLTAGARQAFTGDDASISVAPRVFGTGSNVQTVIFLKPTDAGESSDLVFTTNRRVYTIRVVVKPHDYTPRITFTYPDDEAKHDLDMEQETVQKSILADEKKAAEERLAQLDTTRPVQNTDYEIKAKGRHARYLRPLAVWDDGIRTDIKLPPDIATLDLPIPKIYNEKGQDSPNYRYSHDPDGVHLHIDAVFAKCELLSGVGKHQQKVLIMNLGRKQENRKELAQIGHA